MSLRQRIPWNSCDRQAQPTNAPKGPNFLGRKQHMEPQKATPWLTWILFMVYCKPYITAWVVCHPLQQLTREKKNTAYLGLVFHPFFPSVFPRRVSCQHLRRIQPFPPSSTPSKSPVASKYSCQGDWTTTGHSADRQGCTPIPTWAPYGKSLQKPYTVGIYRL